MMSLAYLFFRFFILTTTICEKNVVVRAKGSPLRKICIVLSIGLSLVGVNGVQ